MEKRTCSVCERKSKTKMMHCSRCKNVFYCSKKCQTSAWKIHKLRCLKETKIDKTASPILLKRDELISFEKVIIPVICPLLGKEVPQTIFNRFDLDSVQGIPVVGTMMKYGIKQCCTMYTLVERNGLKQNFNKYLK